MTFRYRAREFEIDKQAVDDAIAAGIFARVFDALRAVRHSARYTSPLGNRRYGDVVMREEGGRITHFHSASPATLLAYVAVICPDCEGDGGYCYSCDSRGRQRVSRARMLEEGLTLIEE